MKNGAFSGIYEFAGPLYTMRGEVKEWGSRHKGNSKRFSACGGTAGNVFRAVLRNLILRGWRGLNEHTDGSFTWLRITTVLYIPKARWEYQILTEKRKLRNATQKRNN